MLFLLELSLSLFDFVLFRSGAISTRKMTHRSLQKQLVTLGIRLTPDWGSVVLLFALEVNYVGAILSYPRNLGS